MSVPVVDYNSVGSVGSIVGAALESSGHYLQSEVLQILDGGLATGLGAFVFIVSGISAVFIYAVGGNYKYGLWFFFGVPVFFLLINSRVPSSGADWQLGSRIYNKDYVRDAAYNTSGPLQTQSGEVVYVSSVFAAWNTFSSGVVQRFVSLLEEADEGVSNLQFLSRGDRYLELFNLNVTDPNLKFFFDNFISTQCSSTYTARISLYDENIDIGRKERLDCELFKDGRAVKSQILPTDYPRNNPAVWNAVLAHRQTAVDACDPATACDPCENVCHERFCPQPFTAAKTEYTCTEMWDVLVALFKIHANELVTDVVISDHPDEVPTEAMMVEVLKNFRGQELSGNPFSDLPMDDTQASLSLINEVSARMLLRQLATVNMDSTKWGTQVNPAHWNLQGQDSNQDIARSIRELSTSIEYLHKGNFITYVLSMPYLQGLGLFFLAMSFPFFAMACIAPGHGRTILLWFGLWFWVKSWDMGMAIVMYVDKLLYALLPHGPPLGEMDMRDPGKAFKSLLEVDPAYSSFVYYNLLATCIASVPILTGILVQRGGQEIMNALNQGFQNFGGRVGHSLSQYQRNLQAQAHAARSKARTYNRLARGFENAWERAGMSEVFTNSAVMRSMQAAFAAGNGWGGTEIAVALAEAERNRQAGIAMARFKVELAKEVYEAATDAYTRYQEGRLSGLGMFARRLTNEFYGDALLGVIQATHNPNLPNDWERTVFGNLGQFAVQGNARQQLLDSFRNAALVYGSDFVNEDGEYTLQSVGEGVAGVIDSARDVYNRVTDPENAGEPDTQRVYSGTPAQFVTQIDDYFREDPRRGGYSRADRALALGIAESISGMDPMYSNNGQHGLFGLTVDEFEHANRGLRLTGDLDIFNPEHNTRAAEYLFRQHLSRFGQIDNDPRLPNQDMSASNRATAIFTIRMGGLDASGRINEELYQSARDFVERSNLEDRVDRLYRAIP